ncbi:hypothetical protein ACI2K4_20720 [Micromonospora sp. NPDC050397]|uniref:hypothetical protein n=1 Tax=Micromonospora sp. NPDC050397 TaxID=3364279 RepID=UPI00384DFBD2
MNPPLRNTVLVELTHKSASGRWDCGRCGHPWPCAPGRGELTASFGGDRVALAMYMATELVRAARELREPTPAQLHERFIAWTR